MIPLSGLSYIEVLYGFILLFLLLLLLYFVVVNYRKGEIYFMKSYFKKYISEIVEQDINNKLKG